MNYIIPWIYNASSSLIYDVSNVATTASGFISNITSSYAHPLDATTLPPKN